MRMPATAMIVAGGRGTRLLPLTARTPKPMLDFCGAPFLVGVGRRLADVGVRRILLVVGADPTPFAPLTTALAAYGVEVAAVPEPEPLDTAGGVRFASLDVDDAFLVLNGDILTDLDMAELVAHHAREGADATIALTRVEDTSSFGVCLRQNGRITGFVEKPAPGTLHGHDTVNAGTYVFEPGVLETFSAGPLSFERTVFPELLASGRIVAGHVHEGVWSDLGTPDRLLAGQRDTLAGALRWPPLEDLRGDGNHAGSGPDDRTAGGETVLVARGAVVHPTAVLRGPVVIADRARIHAGAVIGPGTVLAAGVEVAADAIVESSLIGPCARVGAGAHVIGALVAEGADLGEGCVVERLSVIGPGVRLAAGSRVAPGSRLDAPVDDRNTVA
jgi:mannose-1-phosphate guanylyltransferase